MLTSSDRSFAFVMVSETATSYLDVMLCTLYILMEAGSLLDYGSSSSTYKSTPLHGEMKDQTDTVDEWKHELASHGRKGASSVDDWVDGWFKLLGPDSRRSCSKDVKRGNVETYLSGSYLPSYPHWSLTDRTSLRARSEESPR